MPRLSFPPEGRQAATTAAMGMAVRMAEGGARTVVLV